MRFGKKEWIRSKRERACPPRDRPEGLVAKKKHHPDKNTCGNYFEQMIRFNIAQPPKRAVENAISSRGEDSSKRRMADVIFEPILWGLSRDLEYAARHAFWRGNFSGVALFVKHDSPDDIRWQIFILGVAGRQVRKIGLPTCEMDRFVPVDPVIFEGDKPDYKKNHTRK